MLACGEGEYRGMDIGITLLPGSVMHTSIRACFLCYFYNPYMFLFSSKCMYMVCVLQHTHFVTCSCMMYVHFRAKVMAASTGYAQTPAY